MDKAEAISKVRRYKLLLNKYYDVDQVYLYGSYAKDTNTEDSDIDVAIVVNQLSGDFFSTTPLLWKLRRQVDDRIEPILIERQNDPGGFLDEVKKYGIAITG
ncbi:MAG: nucleotidyltransferase [Bacteroidetes bacterium 4572_114]|nr:MAG: nucleotidyltransferase [Bacteroidetes bacterium 4572_114]